MSAGAIAGRPAAGRMPGPVHPSMHPAKLPVAPSPLSATSVPPSVQANGPAGYGSAAEAADAFLQSLQAHASAPPNMTGSTSSIFPPTVHGSRSGSTAFRTPVCTGHLPDGRAKRERTVRSMQLMVACLQVIRFLRWSLRAYGEAFVQQCMSLFLWKTSTAAVRSLQNYRGNPAFAVATSCKIWSGPCLGDA